MINKLEKPDRFIHLVQGDSINARLHAEIIKKTIRDAPMAKNIILPIYGICFDDSTSSRFPKKLKRFHNFISFISSELRLRKKINGQLKQFLNEQEMNRCIFNNGFSWTLCLCLVSLYNAFNSKKLILSNENGIVKGFWLRGIEIGCLLIDTYLRYKPSFVFDENDLFVKNISTRAQALFIFYSILFRKKNTCLVCGFTTYIHNGIPAEIIYKNKQKLISIGSSRCLYRIHDTFKESPLISAHPDHTLFTLSKADKATDLLQAERTLSDRLQSKYDSSMSYMMHIKSDKNSSESNNPKIESGSTILMLHAFNDSVHIYRWFLFLDFWEWATQTVDVLLSAGRKIYIKPHPNTDQLSIKALVALKQKYQNSSKITWLANNVQNSYIFNSYPNLVVTGYGSVTIEAAYAGVPVLVAGDYAGINLDLAMSPKNKQEYFSYLLNPDSSNLKQKKERSIKVQSFLKNAQSKPQLMSKFSKTRLHIRNQKFLSSDAVNKYLSEAFDTIICDLT